MKGKDDPGITFDDRPLIPAGEYLAYARTATVYRDGGYKRWTCMIMFDVLAGDGMAVVAKNIPLWLNLGMRDRPHAGRRSRYFLEWIKANGGVPKRGDRLSPRAFTHRMAKVEIGDSVTDVRYSVVRQILSWETGEILESKNQYSNNLLISIQPSTSPINAGKGKRRNSNHLQRLNVKTLKVQIRP